MCVWEEDIDDYSIALALLLNLVSSAHPILHSSVPTGNSRLLESFYSTISLSVVSFYNRSFPVLVSVVSDEYVLLFLFLMRRPSSVVGCFAVDDLRYEYITPCVQAASYKFSSRNYCTLEVLLLSWVLLYQNYFVVQLYFLLEYGIRRLRIKPIQTSFYDKHDE